MTVLTNALVTTVSVQALSVHITASCTITLIDVGTEVSFETGRTNAFVTSFTVSTIGILWANILLRTLIYIDTSVGFFDQALICSVENFVFCRMLKILVCILPRLIFVLRRMTNFLKTNHRKTTNYCLLISETRFLWRITKKYEGVQQNIRQNTSSVAAN